VEPTGAEVLAHCRLGEPGTDVVCTAVARLRPGPAARRGQSIRLGVDVHRLYFFDPGNGDAIAWPCGASATRSA
jgi:hypothetical protein